MAEDSSVAKRTFFLIVLLLVLTVGFLTYLTAHVASSRPRKLIHASARAVNAVDPERHSNEVKR
jgi:hypothetical protein